jgi:hypothetical protein
MLLLMLLMLLLLLLMLLLLVSPALRARGAIGRPTVAMGRPELIHQARHPPLPAPVPPLQSTKAAVQTMWRMS